jgi:hypothetical protein
VHICFITHTDYVSDARSRAYVQQLQGVGHKVEVIAFGLVPNAPDWLTLLQPDPQVNQTFWYQLRRRLGITVPKRRSHQQLFIDAAVLSGAELFAVLSKKAWPMANKAALLTGGSVLAPPAISEGSDLDLIHQVPAKPHLSRPGRGASPSQPATTERATSSLEAQRHLGKEVVLCYRRNETSPGRYLEEALQYAGVDVIVHIDAVDLSMIKDDTDAVVFVESPHPPLSVTGSTKAPVLFWVHHGEHHLAPNVRLTRRYFADAVLLAHSWHLALHFEVPVHRYPFGAATRFFHSEKRHSERSFDVGLVGARLFGEIGPYGLRQKNVQALTNELPSNRIAFRENLAPAEMAHIYSDSRIVLNDGGTRHFPITMRVLEAVASGALLLTEGLPGTDQLLPLGAYATQSGDIVGDVAQLLNNPEKTQRMADSALRHTLNFNTYDHRVDELLEIATHTKKHMWPPSGKRSTLASVIDDDSSVQRIAQFGAPDLASELPTREIPSTEELPAGALAPGKMEAVALVADKIDDHLELLHSARRFIYYQGDVTHLLPFLTQHHPTGLITTSGSVTRVDLQADGYTMVQSS